MGRGVEAGIEEVAQQSEAGAGMRPSTGVPRLERTKRRRGGIVEMHTNRKSKFHKTTYILIKFSQNYIF